MKVLLVEDDASLREGLTELVSELADVVPAGTVKEALRALDRQVFDLVLTDLRIGGGPESGRQVVAAARTCCTPVVILSAMMRSEVDRLLAELPPDGYLAKPFQLDEALDITDHFLSRRGEAERLAGARPPPEAFAEVGPGHAVAVVDQSQEREVRWFRIAPEARAEWRPDGRELSLIVEGVVHLDGAERAAGDLLHVVPRQALRLHAPAGAVGLTVVTRGRAGGIRSR